MNFSTAEVLSTNLRQKHTIALFAWLISHQHYFSLGTNQPPTTNQQYFSLITNQLQPSATSQTNKLHVGDLFTRGWTNGNDDRKGNVTWNGHVFTSRREDNTGIHCSAPPRNIRRQSLRLEEQSPAWICGS
jgi:hypothetical protein